MSEHRRADDANDTPVPDRAGPRWTLADLAALLGTLFAVTLAVISLVGVGYVIVYRVGALEKAQAEHAKEVAEFGKLLDAKFDKIDTRETKSEESQRAVATEHGTRLTQLEDHYGAILTALGDINKHLDAIDARHR